MTGLTVLLRKELLEQWRTMRLVIVTIVFIAFGIMSAVFARYLGEIVTALVPADQIPVALPTPTMADAIDQLVKNVGQTLSLGVILLAMGLVASEKERGTAAFILTRPASRAAFITAKLAALAVTLGVAMAACGAAAYAYTAWLFEPPPAAGFAATCLLLWLSLLAVGALTLLGSTLVRSTVAAGAIGFAAYVGLAIVSALPTIGPYTPAGLFGPAMRLGAGADAGDVVGPVLANVLIVAGATVAAWLALRRQEL
jgi:ABC-2 type transport system permease protein